MSDNKEKNNNKSFKDLLSSVIKNASLFDKKKPSNKYIKDDVYKKVFTDFANNVSSDDKTNNNKMVASTNDLKKAANLLKSYKKKLTILKLHKLVI